MKSIKLADATLTGGAGTATPLCIATEATEEPRTLWGEYHVQHDGITYEPGDFRRDYSFEPNEDPDMWTARIQFVKEWVDLEKLYGAMRLAETKSGLWFAFWHEAEEGYVSLWDWVQARRPGTDAAPTAAEREEYEATADQRPAREYYFTEIPREQALQLVLSGYLPWKMEAVWPEFIARLFPPLKA